MSEGIANHSEESQEIQSDPETEALFESFGIPKQVEKKDIEFPKMDEPEEPLTTEEEEEEVQEDTSPKRKFKYKYNGEEGEVDEEEAPTWIQKGMNYDKVQQKLVEQQKALDEVAQLQGYKNHEEFLSQLPKLREQKEQQRQTELDALKSDILDNLEDAGYDRDKAEQWIESHPLFQEGKKAIEERQRVAKQTSEANKWQPLYEAYPELVEAIQKANGQPVEWYTPELKALIDRGNDPLLAYEYLNKQTIQERTKKATEQKIIKQQQLGARGHVEGKEVPNDEPTLLPAQIALAEEFGVDVKGVQRQQKLLKNRR